MTAPTTPVRYCPTCLKHGTPVQMERHGNPWILRPNVWPVFRSSSRSCRCAIHSVGELNCIADFTVNAGSTLTRTNFLTYFHI
jgi:hypothetical protein